MLEALLLAIIATIFFIFHKVIFDFYYVWMKYVKQDRHFERLMFAQAILLQVYRIYFGWLGALLLFSIGGFIYLKGKDIVMMQRQKAYRQALRFQFPVWLRQLQILLENNTVLVALQMSIPQAPTLLVSEIEQLIQRLEQDSQSYHSYVLFFQEERLHEVERIMKMLYRYQHLGQKDSFYQLNRMIESTGLWLKDERQNRNNQRIFIYQWWGMLPLFSVTILYMVMMYQVVITLFGRG